MIRNGYVGSGVEQQIQLQRWFHRLGLRDSTRQSTSHLNDREQDSAKHATVVVRDEIPNADPAAIHHIYNVIARASVGHLLPHAIRRWG